MQYDLPNVSGRCIKNFFRQFLLEGAAGAAAIHRDDNTTQPSGIDLLISKVLHTRYPGNQLQMGHMLLCLQAKTFSLLVTDIRCAKPDLTL